MISMSTKMAERAAYASRKVFTTSFSLLSLAALLALMALFALGTWQVKRLYWKEALIARVAERLQAPLVPVESLMPFPRSPGPALGALEYRRVSASGTFEHKHSFFYYATHKGVAGYHLYTLFRLAGPEQRLIFVNRGFVPETKKEPDTRAASLVSGVVDLSGLLRAPDDEKPNRFIPDNDVVRNIFFWRDLEVMANRSGLDLAKVEPLVLYADQGAGAELPIGGVSLVDFPNSHLSYALTWYGLALTLVGVYTALLIGRIRTNRLIASESSGMASG